ncbi:MFS transporter [Nocardioides cynanchi]|uniref:MFS transporter n=1 Tax=Nocardioides cynanchi TaxID=2558918 RepID=UPI0012440071|nr:MFS transporter [Nocardioides cynanchi]
MAGTVEVTVGQSLRRVLANKPLRRVQLAFFGSLVGDWAYGTALTVWAYRDGGAAAVGAFTAARFVSMAFTAPLGAVVADRVPRRAFMITLDLVRAVLVAGAALSLGVGGPSWTIYALGLLAAVVGGPFRAAQAGLIPQLVDEPEQLTAANAVAANLENVVVFVGPALGAALVGLTGVELVFWVNVGSFLVSFLLVLGVRVPHRPATTGDPAADDEEGGFLRQVTAGFALVARERDLRTTSLLAFCQGFIWGALMVFLVVLAVTTLNTGPAGVGFLNTVIGAMTIVGGAVVLGRMKGGRLGSDMTLGVLGWSVPLLVMAAVPSPITTVLALAVIGLMDPWVNLGLETIPQRIAPERAISRVYAAVDSSLTGAIALGALVAPWLLDTLGLRGSLALLGVVVTAYAVSTWPHMRRLDVRLEQPVTLPLLSSLALFAPLSPATRESLARRLVQVDVAPGTVVVAEGEVSDRFYVIGSGEVQVTQAGTLLRTETDGDFFGEIGLLRDVPRTASVTATSPTRLYALDRAEFLGAVTGHDDSLAATEEVVTHRLAV